MIFSCLYISNACLNRIKHVYSCFFRYVTIQRGAPSGDRFGGGQRGGGFDSQVGSNSLISRDSEPPRVTRAPSRSALLRERLLRKPRERVAALRERRSRRSPLKQTNKQKRSPGVSIVYPSPSIDSLLLPVSSTETETYYDLTENLIPALPVKPDVAYVFPQTSGLRSHFREKKQIFTENTKNSDSNSATEQTPASTLAQNEEHMTKHFDENNQEDPDYSDWDYEVGQVSVSQSESFSVTKLIGDFINVVTTTLRPSTLPIQSIFSNENEPEPELTTMKTEIPTTSAESKQIVNKISVLASSQQTSKQTNNLKNLFKSNKHHRVHPFLSSKTTTATTEAPVTTTTRRSFALKKNLLGPKSKPVNPETTENTEIKKDASDKKDALDMKLMKMMPLMNIRDAKEVMKKVDENLVLDNENENDEQENTETVKEKVDFLLANRNGRPKFQVPPSLQAKLLNHETEIEKETTTEKDLQNAATSRPKVSPIKLFNKPNVRPFKPVSPRKLAITENPIEAPKRNGLKLLRPQKPILPDLDVSPSRTITRARTSLRRPSLISSSQTSLDKSEQELTSTTTTELPTTSTEKLTVGEILAGLHGDMQGDLRTSTFRPRSFKPKSDGNKRRERFRLLLNNGTDTDSENVIEEDEEDDDAATNEVSDSETTEDTIDVDQVTLKKPKLTLPGIASIKSRANSISRKVQRPSFPRTTVSRSKLERSQPLTVRSRTSKPRKFKKQPQISSFKLEIDPDLPAGEKILTGADLLTSLGLDMNEENIPENLDVTTYRPESVSRGILESLFVENKNEPKDIQEQINPPQPPSPISVADILKSAVVEQAATPPAPKLKSEKKSFEKSQKRPIQAQVNRFDSSRSRSRARAPVLSHRFRPINADISEITTAKPLSQLRNSNNNAVINNRRLRVRQRGQTNTKTTAKISSSEDTLTSTSTGTTESPANTGSTRGLSRHRSRVVNQRRINPPSSGNTTERNLSTPPISLSAFGSRQTGSSSLNRTSIPRLNTNRVRVRSRTRQNIVASSSQTTSPISEQSSETVAQKQRLNSSSEKSLGKLEILDEDTTQVNTIETNNNTQQENEQEIQEDKEQEEEKSTLRPSVFKPRFGTGQRDAVRNRLRNQLLEGKPNPVTKAPLRSFDELVNEKKLSNEVESVTENTYTAAFKTVSPSNGLNAIPISFFTTTPRFLSKDDKTSTTEKPKPAAFLPTLTPLQRVGRSTIGYPVTQETIVTTTEKPKPATNNISRFNNFKRKSKVRPKFGQRHSTTEKSTVDSDLNDLLGTTLIGISTTSLPTTVYSQEEGISTENPENIVQKVISNKKIRPKSAFFSRPRGDFLSSFAKKIAEKADREKILLESFGGNKKAPVSSILKSSAFNEIDGELKRPRRRFNVGPGIKLNSEHNQIDSQENQTDSNSTNDEEKAIADPSTNATLTNKNITDTDTITEKPQKERNLNGPPKLPKGLRLPFDTKRFGALQPKLLSFQIIKPKSKTTKSKPKPKITKSDSKQSKSSSESNSDNSVASKVKTDKSKLSLKERLKFGRKTFGALLKSPSNRFKLLPTPAPKSNKNPKSGFKSKKSTPSSNTSTMPPPSPADTTLPQVAFSNARPQKNPTTLFKICSES